MYKKDFDCPPGEGIPCTSVTTLEKMIVESPCGPDIFLGCVPKLVDVQVNPACKCTSDNYVHPSFQRRIWISKTDADNQPVYYYFPEENPCEER
jgi:hypothetical protein